MGTIDIKDRVIVELISALLDSGRLFPSGNVPQEQLAEQQTNILTEVRNMLTVKLKHIDVKQEVYAKQSVQILAAAIRNGRYLPAASTAHDALLREQVQILADAFKTLMRRG